MAMQNEILGYPCKGFEMEDIQQTWKHMQLEPIRHYGDECNGHDLYVFDEGKRYLARCSNCGGLVLVQQSEAHGEEDFYYLDCFPVGSSAEAEALNAAYDGFGIEERFPKRFLMSTNGRLSWFDPADLRGDVNGGEANGESAQ